MKLGILTLKPRNNYGGILQAYALQTWLKRLGHDVYIINRNIVLKPLLLATAITVIKRIIKKYLLRRRDILRIICKETLNDQRVISQHTSQFIQKYNRPATPDLCSEKDLLLLDGYNFDAYIVGSDQVWRSAYTGDAFRNYFLDFVKSNNTKKIAYAASFGVDTWQFSKEHTRELDFLLHKFCAVSVREDSAVELCRKHLNIAVEHVLDPTLLLQPDDYIQLAISENAPNSPGDLLVYIIDNTEDKKNILNYISEYFNYVPFSVHKKSSEMDSPLEDRTFPPVTNWLQGFMDAKYVITDSFHGCAFSILFNKPFIVFGNKDRGMARFGSLLRIFSLEDRLICSAEELTDKLLSSSIDWKRVNLILKEKREFSAAFLNGALSQNKG